MLFAYPAKAKVGRVLPKSKIYEHTRTSVALRKKLTDQVQRMVWVYKLSPETTNLGATESVPEIEIFEIELKGGDISPEVIRFIDRAIPFPIIYEIVGDGKRKVMAAYKRPSDADSGKWVTDIYFESDWERDERERKALPVALDLGRLYEQLLIELSPVTLRDGESIREATARIGEIRKLLSETDKLASKMKKEKQFNRKVELNAQLRRVRARIAELSH